VFVFRGWTSPARGGIFFPLSPAIAAMPNIAVFHPQIVHFVVALLIVGVLLRLASLVVKWKWTSPAATALILAGTVAAAAAVKSGDQAHGPAERVPGARNAVVEHEEWGNRTRNIFFGVAALELLALVAGADRRKWVHMGAAAVGLWGAFALYETGEHGGELVYSYAGGVGVRSGDPADVTRLLTAGLYHQAMQDRKDGKLASASALLQELAARNPTDAQAVLMAVESRFRDLADTLGARQALDALAVPADERLKRNQDLLKVDLLAAVGQKDSARAILAPIAAQFPTVPRFKAKLDSLR
jgi:uncharacterized membrane protein